MSLKYKVLSLLPFIKSRKNIFAQTTFKEYNASQLALYLDGVVDGNPDVSVTSAAKIEEGRPGTLTFLANPKYTQYIYTTNASIVIVSKLFKPEQPITSTLIRVDDPYSAFAKLLNLYKKDLNVHQGIARSARIARSAKIGKNVYVGDCAVIGENVVIGDNCKIFCNVTILESTSIGSNVIVYPNAVICDSTKIGNNCTIHPGAIIGSDGFGFAPLKMGGYMKIPQTGNVVIEDDVEVGACSVISRATMGSTTIRKDTKIDNLVQIGHNCEIGEDCVIAAQSGISGSSKVGKNAMIGGQVGVAGHLKIGNNVKIAAKSGILSSIEDDSAVMGAPSFEARKYLKAYAHFRNFNKIVSRIDELEKTLAKTQK